MQKLSVTAVGTSFVALVTFGTTSANAALLDFSFTTAGGSTGSFILDTDTASDPNPALGVTDDGTVIEVGFAYPNAVSDFSLTTASAILSGVTADFGVFTAAPLDPPNTGILSAVEYPSGCLTTTDFFCLVDVDLGYTGSTSELPVLSDDPLSYSTGLVLRIPDFATGLVNEEPITDLQVTNLQAVPEPNSILGELAIGVGAAGLLVSRKMNKNKAAKKLYF